MDLYLCSEEYRKILEENGVNSAETLWKLSGETAKDAKTGRSTEKITLGKENKINFFLKRYQKQKLSEILKNIFQFKPLFLDGALHEWKAMNAFLQNNIPAPKPVAAAKFADGRSCVLSEEIPNFIRASQFFANTDIQTEKRRNLIAKIAEITAKMHAANFAHQDLYLLHFFIVPDENYKVYLIDLQRVIFGGNKISERWIIKDLGQFYYSASECFSKDDFDLFLSEYRKFFPQSEKILPQIIKKIEKKASSIRNRQIRKSR